MTVPPLPDRDGAQVDALVADRYLDALLDGSGPSLAHNADGGPSADDGPDAGTRGLDPGVLDAARVLRRTLVRVHPSFRFEERLAGRLAELAAAQSAPAMAVAGGVVIPFPVGRQAAPRAAADADPLLPAILRGDLDPTDEAAVDRAATMPPDRRPLLIGGAALTSAAISIVGVAIVAWRASRPAGRGPRAGFDLLGPA